MPLPVSSTAFSARDPGRVDEGQAVPRVVLFDGAPLGLGARGRGIVGVAPGQEGLLDLLDAGVAGEGERPLAHHLDAVPLLGVVGGGDDGAAVEVVAGGRRSTSCRCPPGRCPPPRSPGCARPRMNAARELGRGEAGVVAHHDALRAQVVHEGPAHAPRHLGRRAGCGVEAADVVGLEDRRRRRSCSGAPRVVGHDRALAQDRPGPEGRARPIRTPGPSERALELRLGARRRVPPRARCRARAAPAGHRHLGHEGRRGPDLGARLDHAARARRRRAARRRARLRRSGPAAVHDPPPRAAPASVTAKAPAQDVPVHLQVLLGGADVDPVAAVDEAGDAVAAGEQRGEEGRARWSG